MTERTITVRLRMIADDYRRTVQGAAKDTRDLAGASKALGSTDGDIATVGSSLTRNVTLPVIAGAAAVTKLGIDYETTFSRMQGLAGVSADEVEGLKDQVLELGPAVGKSPQELAEALYFIRSAGIDGAEAMDVLEVSAKGAAAGLGSTVAVADAVTSVLGAYKDSAITAADATDILVATAREGKVEPAELASQMGRLLPIAAELGVEFGELGGFIALYSKSGSDASLATTQMNGVLSKMLSPGEKGASALKEIGMNAGMLKSSIKEKGLLGTLEDLRVKLEDNGLGFEAFSDDQQFLQGALMATGSSLEEAKRIIDKTTHAAGAGDQAFAAWADTAGFRNAAAFSQLQASLIELGDTIVPIVTSIVELGADLLEVWDAVPGPIKAVAIYAALLAAAGGPLIKAGVGITSAWSRASTALWSIPKTPAAAQTLGKITSAATAASVAVGGLAAAWTIWEIGVAKQEEGAQRVADSWKTAIDRNGDTFAGAMENMNNLRATISGISDEMNEAKSNPVNWDEVMGLKKGQQEAQKLFDEQVNLIESAIELQRVNGGSLEAAYASITGNEELAISALEGADAFDQEAAAITSAVDALEGYADQLTGMFDPLFAMQDALLGEEAAHAALTEAIRAHGTGSTEAAAAERDLVRALVDTDAAALHLQAAVAAQPELWASAVARIDEWVEAGRITTVRAAEIKAGLLDAAGAGEEFAKTYGADVALTGADRAIAQLEALAALAQQLGSTRVAVAVIKGNAETPIRRDVGGAMHAGGLYLTHEDELVVPEEDKWVFTPSQSRSILAGGTSSTGASMGGGGGVTINETTNIYARSISDRAVARTVRDSIVQSRRRGTAYPR